MRFSIETEELYNGGLNYGFLARAYLHCRTAGGCLVHSDRVRRGNGKNDPSERHRFRVLRSPRTHLFSECSNGNRTADLHRPHSRPCRRCFSESSESVRRGKVKSRLCGRDPGVFERTFPLYCSADPADGGHSSASGDPHGSAVRCGNSAADEAHHSTKQGAEDFRLRVSCHRDRNVFLRRFPALQAWRPRYHRPFRHRRPALHGQRFYYDLL